MRVLPSGSTALLVELDDLDEVLALYATLADDVPKGVVDIVPAARTLLLITDPAVAAAVLGRGGGPVGETAPGPPGPGRARRHPGDL